MEDYYTIGAVAQEVANDQGLYSEHMYFQYTSWAISGYREAQFDIAQEVKTVMLNMNPLRVVQLPNDCIDWVKVGIKVGERVFAIGLNDDMAKYNASDGCGNLIPNTPQIPLDTQPRGINTNAYIPAFLVFNNFGGESLQGEVNPQLGVQWGGGSVGIGMTPFFDVEGKYPNLRMRFSSEMLTQTQVYLEYISDGMEPCGETFVNPYMYEYLRAYTHFRRTQGNDNIALGLKGYWQTEMERQRKIASMRINSISPTDLINSSRKGFKLTLHI